MLDRFRSRLAPPVFEGDEEKTRVVGLLNGILIVMAVGMLVPTALLPFLFGIPANLMGWLSMAAISSLCVLPWGLRYLACKGHPGIAGWTLLAVVWLGTTFSLLGYGGLLDVTIMGYALVVALAGLLLGSRGVWVYTLLSIAAGAFTYYAESNGLLKLPARALDPFDLFGFVLTVGLLALLQRYAVRYLGQAVSRARRNELALAQTNQELQTRRDELGEQQAKLERRARYLSATMVVARETASVLEDVQALLARVVDVIAEQFEFYHTGLFLLDATGEWAELRAASGAGGQRMVAKGLRLRVGREGIVGYVAGRGEARLALDVGQDAVYSYHPDLPETRSELALPLRVRDKIVGVLDVQSQHAEAFSSEDLAVLQALADQVAVALDNAQLFALAQQSLEAERRAYGELHREAWGGLLRSRPSWGYLSDGRDIYPVGDVWEPQMERAIQTGQMIAGDGEEGSLAIPIKIREQVVGVFDGRKPTGAGPWTQDEIGLIEALIGQLSVALEEARLYRDSQQRAAREQLTSKVTARMRETLDVETVLRTAVDEIYQALGLDDLVIRLISDTADKGSPPG